MIVAVTVATESDRTIVAATDVIDNSSITDRDEHDREVAVVEMMIEIEIVIDINGEIVVIETIDHGYGIDEVICDDMVMIVIPVVVAMVTVVTAIRVEAHVN